MVTCRSGSWVRSRCGRGIGRCPITGSRLRALVTRLAADAPGPVSVAELVEAVWPGEPPADPTNALQSLVSRVRRALGDASRIQQVPGGYRLAVDAAEVDVAVFGALVAAGRRDLLRDRPAARRSNWRARCRCGGASPWSMPPTAVRHRRPGPAG